MLVIIGGPGVDHGHYHPWFTALAKRQTVACYDHRGTGRSTASGDISPYDVRPYAAAIDGLRQHLGFDRVSLVGVSFCGLPAVEYALTFPDRLEALVLSNAHVDARGWQEGNIDYVNLTLQRHHPRAWAELMALRDQGMRSLDPAYQDLIGWVLPRLEWAEPWDRPELNPNDTAASLTANRCFIGDDPESVVGGSLAGYAPPLEEISARTVVTGRWDGLTLPVIAAAAADRIPGIRLHVFEQSGHRPWAEEATAYFDVVGTFLAT